MVFEKVMPGELDSRGVSDVPDVCAAVLADLETRGMVSRWRDSARAALDDAIEHRQAVQGGVRAP